MEVIKSYSFDQIEIISNIIKLYCPDGIDLDPCYSKGNFYKSNIIKQPIYKFDLFPQIEGCLQGDCRNLPFDDNSMKTIIYDPPFLATKGPSLNLDNASNKTVKRFGNYETENQLQQFWHDSILEFERILKPKGIIIVKIQDKVSSGKQIWSHDIITQYCTMYNLFLIDLFVLLAKNRMCPDWQVKNQKHARKFHSYFLVFRKE